jgi:hypothetical protein
MHTKPFTTVSIMNHTLFRVGECTLGLRHDAHGSAGSARMQVKWTGRANGFLKFAARRGFQRLTVVRLRRLHKYLKVPFIPGQRPLTEVALVESLVRFVLGPNTTDGQIKNALTSRHAEVDNVQDRIGDTMLFDPGIEEIWREDVGEDEEVLQQLAELKRLKEERDRRECQRLAQLSEMQSAGRAGLVGASAGQQADRGAVARSFVPFPAHCYSAEEAAVWLPPDTKLSKDVARENRWRLRCKRLGGEKSKSWGPRSTTGDYKAMVWLIQLAWRAWTAKSGQACPWNFAGVAV